MDIELPNGTILQGVPEGTSKADIQAKAIKAGLATAADFAPAKPAQPQEAPSGFLQGVMDPVYGAGQLMAKGMQAVGFFPKEAQAFAERVVPQREQQYQAQRAAAGEEGTDWARLGGSLLSPANLLAGGAVGSMVAKPLMQAAAVGATQGALAPVTDTEGFTEEKLKQTVGGGIFGVAGAGLVKGAGAVLNPLVSKAEQTMRDLGVKMTPGQIVGGQAKAFEEFAENLPLVGSYISNAKERGLYSFNKGIINKALKKIDDTLPEDVIGRDAVQHANKAVSNKYDEVLAKMDFKLDFPAYTNILKATRSTKLSNATQRQEVKDIISSEIFSKIPKSGKIDGALYKEIESELLKQVISYKNSATAAERNIGFALGEVLDSMKGALRKQNPEQSSILRRIDSAYGDIAVMKTAAANSGAANGVFTPKQYSTAVRQRDMSRNKTSFAAGTARGQDISDAAINVLERDARSTLEGRLATQASGLMAAFQNPAVAVGLSIGSPVLYSESGIKAMQTLFRSRPDAAKKIGELLTSRATKEGSITGAQVLQEYNRQTAGTE
jgi:hypothetical protein